jgi:hypothetical protein
LAQEGTPKNGTLYFDYTKLSLRADFHWHSKLFGDLFETLVQRYDVTPAIQYMVSNVSTTCQKQPASPETLMGMQIPYGSKFKGFVGKK